MNPVTARVEQCLPAVLVLLFAAALGSQLFSAAQPNAFDVDGFSRLPVLNGGRVKPLDTVARTALLIISGKQSADVDGETLNARRWLMDVLFRPERAASRPIFEIDNPDVLGLLGIQQSRTRRFAFSDLQPHSKAIEDQSTQSQAVKPGQRSPYETAVIDLENQYVLYQKLQHTLEIPGSQNEVQTLRDLETRLVPLVQKSLEHIDRLPSNAAALLPVADRYRFIDQVSEFYAVPLSGADHDPNRWTTYGRSVLTRFDAGAYSPSVIAFARMGDAWRAEDPFTFNAALHEYQTWLSVQVPRDVRRAQDEFLFNQVEPFYQAMVIYIAVFLLAFISWLAWEKALNRSAFALLLLAFTVHTVGLVVRMWLQGRPPVTNLYSSAIFVGWVAVLLGIILERLYRNGIGSMVSSTIGFVTLIIAHHLASSGDTLEMMRAVLDSNFWLATHVVCITTGYSSTFLAGFLATLYLARRAFDRGWSERIALSLERMVYGVICFAMFFSFLGTILGGIWADQSWGRFWGWDPKENGALMIVLWNAFILHARLGGYAPGPRLMGFAVFGNVVTALSWFGVNMLGIGLHSYGFMDKAFNWLLFFIIIQFGIIGLALCRPRSASQSS